MTLTIRPFVAVDVVGLDLQSLQARDLAAPLTLDYGAELVSPTAWTALDVDRVVGCGGIAEVAGRPHYGIAWTLLDPAIGRSLVRVTRRARREIAGGRWRRVEALVRGDWPAAYDWAVLAGLQPRAELKHWGPAGETYILFDWTAA